MKLYRVKMKGMHTAVTGPIYGDAYVIADNPTEAYEIMKRNIDEWDVGFSDNRVLKSIELIADEERYSGVDRILHQPLRSFYPKEKA